MSATLPKGFDMLEPLIADWALDTQDARQVKRRKASRGELRYFYDNMLPRMPDILTHIDKFPLGELPPESARLFALSLSLAEVAPHIELYGGQPDVPHSFEEERMIASHGSASL